MRDTPLKSAVAQHRSEAGQHLSAANACLRLEGLFATLILDRDSAEVGEIGIKRLGDAAKNLTYEQRLALIQQLQQQISGN